MSISRLTPAYETSLGKCYLGDSLELLKKVKDNSISLVLTSPPFALRRQKAYGNVDAASYVDWILPFAWEIQRILKPDGSFVMDLAGAWNPKKGTRSLFQYELILKLCQRFHLAQEFYWYNPSKLPTPAEWVTIRRTRKNQARTKLARSGMPCQSPLRPHFSLVIQFALDSSLASAIVPRRLDSFSSLAW